MTEFTTHETWSEAQSETTVSVDGHELEVAYWDSEAGRTSLCRDAVATNTNHTTEIDYDAIEADLLALWGSDDEFQPVEYAHRLTDDVGGEVVELDAYHWVVEDRPETYTAEVSRFLTER